MKLFKVTRGSGAALPTRPRYSRVVPPLKRHRNSPLPREISGLVMGRARREEGRECQAPRTEICGKNPLFHPQLRERRWGEEGSGGGDP